jgi:hypothetical protein
MTRERNAVQQNPLAENLEEKNLFFGVVWMIYSKFGRIS